MQQGKARLNSGKVISTRCNGLIPAEHDFHATAGQPSFIQDNDFFMGRLQLHSLRAAALRHAEPAAAVQIRQSAFLPEAGWEFQFTSGSHGGKKYKQHPVPAVFQKSQERNRIPRCFQNPDGGFTPTEKQRC